MARRRPNWPTDPRSVFFSDAAARATVAAAVRSGRIIRLAPGVLTADTISPPEQVTAANLWKIVAHFCPDAIVVDRTAARSGRIDGGLVTIASDARATAIDLPGAVVAVRPRDSHTSDTPWAEGLSGTAPEKTAVDNLVVSRSRAGRPGRTLTRSELQDWVTEKLTAWGRERFDRFVTESVALATERCPDRVDALVQIVDEVTGRSPLGPSAGPFTRASRDGTAWDRQRLALLGTVAESLRELDGACPPARAADGELPFYEAYFSNFIEGTEFTISDARQIVETQTPPARRSADGHDILGTHRCVVDPIGRAQTSTDPEEVVELLRTRHRTLMVGRPDIGPGEFKLAHNRVGGTEFVAPELVHGTLLEAFKGLAALPPGLPRAIFAMVVVTEVHPFTDGNGRAARLLMNAELSAVRLHRVVIPTVLRNEYIGGLRRLTNHHDTTAIVQVVTHALRWTATMPWEDRSATDAQLVATNAVIDSNDAQREGIHLQLP